MIHYKQLSGTKLKKDLDLKRCIKRWHNHNESGGNFGINLYFKDNIQDCELTGFHNKEGNITLLNFGALYGAGNIKLIAKDNKDTIIYEDLINLLKKIANLKSGGVL